MSALGLALSRTRRVTDAPASVRTRLAAAALGAAIVLSLSLLRPIRVGEAMLSASLLRIMGTGADRFGTAVLVDADGARAGFTIASGCSTALLAAPFLALGALALVTGRVRPGRTLVCLAGALVGVVIVNQLRFGIVGAAIHLFGFERGYGQSHVLIGTLVSTLGLVGGLSGFVWALGRDPPGAEGRAVLITLNLLAFALCVLFLTYVAVICISYLRLAPPPPGEVDTFGWHVIVPCLDEDAVVATTIRRLLTTVPAAHLWCVDDASTDQTAAIIAELARTDPRVHLLRRTLPQARQGKGAALNHAWRAISAWEDGTRDRSRVVVGVVDADGELSAGALAALASGRFFGDPAIGAVQAAVRIANRSTGERPAPTSRWRRRLLDLQDLEFVGPIAAMQLLRERTGSVAMGGNGQFTRLSVLDEVAERAGTPWHGALLEDFELGIHVLMAGHRTAYCHHVEVAQEGLTGIPALIRQRSRWAQGAMQCRRYLRPVLSNRNIPNAAAFEIAYFLLLPWIQVAGTLVYASSYVVLAGYLATTAGGPTGWLASGQWGVLPLVALGGIGPFVIWGVIYRARVEPSLTRLQAVGLGLANWLYSNLHYVATWWAVVRVVTRRADWKKTARVAGAPPALGTASGRRPVVPVAVPEAVTT